MPQSSPDFASAVLHWYDQHGRKDLPWQQNPTPYRVWVSEIMLQQTQVTTVIGYYDRFMRRFPVLADLANAPIDDVLALWSGLGYYARARNLHKAAQLALSEHNGELPKHIDQLVEFPGIGRSTAGAILSLACQQRQPILDGNVKRVLARYFAVEGWPGNSKVMDTLWKHAEALTPHTRVSHYTQAMMDIGATLCKRSKPECARCPLTSNCKAFVEDRVGEFPHRKAKKTLPVRKRHMLILESDAGEVLLEKRPPSGIWGGLLALPIFDNAEALQEWCDNNIEGVVQIGEWSLTRHTFSHFRMDITPVHCRIEARPSAIMEATGQVWYKDGTSPGGIPAPVNRLLKQLFHQVNTGA